jgi:HSP20 family protein
MTITRRTTPFGELLSLRQAMDRLFEDSFVPSRSLGNSGIDTQALPLDIYTTPDALVVKAALPGADPEQVDITVNGDTLTISGSNHEERREDQGDYLFQEVRRGSFSRTVSLPANLKPEQATADFQNGMLTLSIPKAEEAKPRQIKIGPARDASSTRAVEPQTAGANGSSSNGH